MQTRFMIFAILFSAATVTAATVSDTYVIPIAGHVSGANGQTWVTDLTLHNVTSSSLVIDLAGIGANGNSLDLNNATVTLPPHGSVTLHDVFGETAVGALIAAGNGEFAIASRVYTDGVRGSVGSDISATDQFVTLESGEALLPGLVANSRYRTNLGFFAVADTTPLQFEIKLVDAAGVILGSRAFEISPHSMSHRHMSSRDIVAIGFEAAAARIRVTGGDGIVIPYGSVVDHFSSDASFVSAALAQQSPPKLLRQQSVVRRAVRWSER